MASPNTDSAWPVIRSLQIIGITVSLLKAGQGLGESFCTIPLILRTTNRQTALTQFRGIYESGLSVAMPSIATGTLTFGYIAWSLYRNPTNISTALNGVVSRGSGDGVWKYYAVASALMATMVPVTLGALIPVVNTLTVELRKGDSGKMTEGEVKELVRLWGMRNAMRQCLPALAGVVALYAGLCL